MIQFTVCIQEHISVHCGVASFTRPKQLEEERPGIEANCGVV